MNANQNPQGLHAVPNQPQMPVTKVLSPKEQYDQITGFLGQLMQQFIFPAAQIQGERVEKLFNDLKKVVEDRLVEEIKQGV